ncbi:MAG: thiamine ABC transporter substrate-binding protein [Anaerolinea sp.]|nr:thiamine ABC transporter substrate-binding protein [Anaerolinea sp.]
MALVLALSLALFVLPGCGGDDDGEATLTLVTHDSFNLSEDVLKEFETQNNATVKVLKKGDAGALVTSLVFTKKNPEGDVSFGVDNTFLSRALDAAVFQPYSSPLLAKVPKDLQADGANNVTPIDYGYVNLNYDIAALKKSNLPVPQKLEDLTDAKYKGLVVVENPASSSPGLAFLIATVDYFGKDKYLEWWGKMRANGLVVVDGWETAYNTNFTLHGGQQPIVLSYATSPAFEQMFAKPARDDSPTGNILPPKGAFRQVEYAGVLKGAKNPALARKFIDFLLSKRVQEDIPGQMAVYPVNSEAAVPEAFEKFAKVTVPPATVSASDIAKNRDTWIADWTKAVLR